MPEHGQGGVAVHLLLNDRELRSQGAASLDLGRRCPVQGARQTEDPRDVACRGIGSRGKPKSFPYGVRLGDERAVLRVKDIEGLPVDACGADSGTGDIARVFRLPGSKRRVEKELDEELSFHIEGRIEELMDREGLSRGEAEREAKRRFGNVDEYRRQARAIDDNLNGTIEAVTKQNV